MINNKKTIIKIQTINKKLSEKEKREIINTIAKAKLTADEYKILYFVFAKFKIYKNYFKNSISIMRYFDKTVEQEIEKLSEFNNLDELVINIKKKTMNIPKPILVYLALILKSFNINYLEKELKTAKLLLR